MEGRTIKSAIIAVVAGGMFWAALGTSTMASMAPNAPPPNGTLLFNNQCALCHGKNGKGLPAWKAKGQPDLTTAAWQSSRTDQQIASQMKKGGKVMPPFEGKLSDAEIAALVAKVRSFGPKKK